MSWAVKLTSVGALLPEQPNIPQALHNLARALEVLNVQRLRGDPIEEDVWIKFAELADAANKALNGRLHATIRDLRSEHGYTLTCKRSVSINLASIIRQM